MNGTVAWMSDKEVEERLRLLEKSEAEKRMVRERRKKEKECWEKELVENLFEDLESLIK